MENQLNIANLERFFLNRLERFARLAGVADASQIPQWRRLARHSTLSAYRDCVTLGLEKEARAILSRSGRQEALSA
jgi:transposase-like protein